MIMFYNISLFMLYRTLRYILLYSKTLLILQQTHSMDFIILGEVFYVDTGCSNVYRVS